MWDWKNGLFLGLLIISNSCIRRSTQIVLLLMKQPVRMNQAMIESWYMRLVIKATKIVDIVGWFCNNYVSIFFTSTSYDEITFLHICSSKIKYEIKSQSFPVNSLLNSKGCGRHIKWIFCSCINLLIFSLISKCHQFRPSRLSATAVERYAVTMMLNIIWNSLSANYSDLVFWSIYHYIDCCGVQYE